MGYIYKITNRLFKMKYNEDMKCIYLNTTQRL